MVHSCGLLLMVILREDYVICWEVSTQTTSADKLEEGVVDTEVQTYPSHIKKDGSFLKHYKV